MLLEAVSLFALGLVIMVLAVYWGYHECDRATMNPQPIFATVYGLLCVLGGSVVFDGGTAFWLIPALLTAIGLMRIFAPLDPYDISDLCDVIYERTKWTVYMGVGWVVYFLIWSPRC